MSARVRFYNPREASPEILEAMLVGREDIIRELLDDLVRQSASTSRQHWLIRGPRGIGKTHLIGILYHRIRKAPALQKAFLPIWLAETEAYSVYSAAILLLQIAQQMIEELRRSGGDGLPELEARVVELSRAGDHPALFEEACQLLKDEARRRRKTLLVLMENLDALLANLRGTRGAQDVRRFRSLLSEDKELLFLSTTPTRYLTALSDPKQPLYGHLKERTLMALSEDEVGQLLGRLAETTGQPEKAVLAGPEVEGRVRRRVLHRLTGGNPRAIVMAFSVLTGNPGVQAMVEEMSALLDAQTAYFESRLAQLAPRERSIVAAMSLSRQNLTLQEIAGLTHLPSRSLSTQIDRLVEQGHVAPVAGEGGKGTIYELSDGLFRLWYQFRKGVKVLEPIVEFLAVWHPADEIEKALTDVRSTAVAVSSFLERDLLKLTELQITEALKLARSEKGQALRHHFWGECATESLRSKKVEALKDLQTLCELLLNLKGSESAEELLALARRFRSNGTLARLCLEHDIELERVTALLYSNLAFELTKLDLGDEALLVDGEFIARFGESQRVEVRVLIAAALFRSGAYLTTLRRWPEQKEMFDKLVSSFSSPNEDAVIQWYVCSALFLMETSDLNLGGEEASSHLVKSRLLWTDFLERFSGSNLPNHFLWFASYQRCIIDWVMGANEGTERALANLLLEGSEIRSLDPSIIKTLLEPIVSLGRVEVMRSMLKVLAASKRPEIAEMAMLYRFVLETAEAKSFEPGTRQRKGRGARLRQVLARVPRELRQTVEERAEEIHRLRQVGQAGVQSGLALDVPARDVGNRHTKNQKTRLRDPGNRPARKRKDYD